jgi:hypothetical protein
MKTWPNWIRDPSRAAAFGFLGGVLFSLATLWAYDSVSRWIGVEPSAGGDSEAAASAQASPVRPIQPVSRSAVRHESRKGRPGISLDPTRDPFAPASHGQRQPQRSQGS